MAVNDWMPVQAPAKDWMPVAKPAQVAPPPEPAAPTLMQKAQASTPGAVLQGAVDPVYGIGQGFRHAEEFVTSLGGLAPNPVSRYFGGVAKAADKSVAGREQSYQDARKATGQSGLDLPRLGGNIISPVNLVGGGAALTARGAGLGARMLAGAGAGAVAGAAQPVTDTTDESFASQKAKQTGIGAVTGGAVPALGAAASKVIAPQLSKSAQLLKDAGVRLTTGHQLGRAASATEDKIKSLPLTGDAITAARMRERGDFNLAAANKALAPINDKLPDGIEPGHAALAEVDKRMTAAYDDVLSRVSGTPDPSFRVQMQTVINDATQKLPPEQIAKLKQVVDAQIVGKLGSGAPADGQTVKGIMNELRIAAEGYSKDPGFDNRQLGQAIGKIKDAVHGMLVRNNPTQAARLKAVDRGYAAFARVRDAASRSADGVFSPAQLQQAVRRGDKSAGKGATAKGRALLQDISRAGMEVLPEKIGNSGTWDRAALGMGAMGVGAYSPAVPVGLLGGAAAYTKPGQAFINGLMFSRPAGAKALAGAVKRGSLFAGSPLAALATGQNPGP